MMVQILHAKRGACGKAKRCKTDLNRVKVDFAFGSYEVRYKLASTATTHTV